MAHINTGIPVSPIISDAIIPLFLQVTNTGFLSREFQRSAPVPKCQILDIPPPVRIGTFVSKRLTIRDLSGCFGVAFGFSGLALLVTFLHRKKKRLRRGEPEAIKITGMDQYGQVFSRLDEKGDLPFLRIHAVRDGDTILLKEDGADNNDLPDGRRERRSNTRSLPVQQRIRYKVGSFSTRMKQHIKAREASTRHQFGVSMSERMLSFATKTSKISLRPRRKSLVAMNETSDRRERDISKNSGVTIGDSMSSLSIPNIVEITDSSSEEAAHDRREHSKPVDHDDVRNKKRPQGQLKKPPPTENIFQDQIQGDQSPIPTHPQRRRDTFQRQESISPIPPASLNHKNSNVDNPFRRQTSIAPDNPFRQTATANPFRQRGLQPQLSTRSSAMSAHSANSRQSGQGASRASSEASLYEENDSIRHPILSSEAPSRPGSNRALVRATSSRPKQRRRIITPPPPQAKVQTKTSRKPTSTRKEELRPSKRLPALELPAESKKSSSHREKGRMLVLQASGGELAVTKTGSSSSPSPKEDVQFHMGSYVKETTQTTEQQNKSSKKKKKKKTERKESRPMTPTVSFTDDNLFLVDNDDMVESG